MELRAGGWKDNVQRRIDWEAASGGTVTLDEAVRPPLWRARDKADRELVQADDLGVVMDFLDRLEDAQGRQVAFAVRYPQARFWTSGGDATGPLRYHGSLPAPVDRVESGPHRELADLMSVMEALAARAMEMRGK